MAEENYSDKQLNVIKCAKIRIRVINYLVARARVLALRIFSVAIEVYFHFLGAPTFYRPLGSHQGGAQASAVVVAELDCSATDKSAQPARYSERGSGEGWWLRDDHKRGNEEKP